MGEDARAEQPGQQGLQGQEEKQAAVGDHGEGLCPVQEVGGQCKALLSSSFDLLKLHSNFQKSHRTGEFMKCILDPKSMQNLSTFVNNYVNRLFLGLCAVSLLLK